MLKSKCLTLHEIQQINDAMETIHCIMTDIEYSRRDSKIYGMLDEATGFLYNAIQNSYVDMTTLDKG